jgi:hypothetical protein
MIVKKINLMGNKGYRIDLENSKSFERYIYTTDHTWGVISNNKFLKHQDAILFENRKLPIWKFINKLKELNKRYERLKNERQRRDEKGCR